MDGRISPDLSALCYRSKGERLSYLRNQAGLTIGAAAKRTGISSSELSRIENDRRRLTRKHLTSFAEAYGLSPSELEGILEFNPAGEFIRYTPVQEMNDGGEAGNCSVPCYLSTMVTGVGLSVGQWGKTKLPDGLRAGPLTYAVRLMEADGGYFFQPETLLVVNPQARVTLGDLVINSCTWSPLLVSIVRNSIGQLAGRCLGDCASFPQTTLLTSFHKVIAILPP